MKKFNGSRIQKQINDDKERRGLIRYLTERFCAQFNASSEFTGSPLRMYYQENYWLFEDKSLRYLRAYAKRAARLDAVLTRG